MYVPTETVLKLHYSVLTISKEVNLSRTNRTKKIFKFLTCVSETKNFRFFGEEEIPSGALPVTYAR